MSWSTSTEEQIVDLVVEAAEPDQTLGGVDMRGSAPTQLSPEGPKTRS